MCCRERGFFFRSSYDGLSIPSAARVADSGAISRNPAARRPSVAAEWIGREWRYPFEREVRLCVVLAMEVEKYNIIVGSYGGVVDVLVFA